jgi:hypothetical protein
MSVSRRDFRSAYLNTLGFQEVPIQSAVVSLLREPVIGMFQVSLYDFTPTSASELVPKIYINYLKLFCILIAIIMMYSTVINTLFAITIQ